MTSDERAVQALYRSDPEREWQRMARHRTEFAVTLRAFEAHLPPPPAEILDCGGGPGRYAIALAKQGYRVTLFDLSPELLALARQKAARHEVELAGFEQGTATDLSRFPNNRFDAVLLMGPLYHLLNEADRRRALSEAYRVAQPDAPVMAAFIARYAGYIDAIARYPAEAPKQPDLYQRIAKTGVLRPRPDGTVGFTAYFTHPDEVQPLCRAAGLEVEMVLGVEGLASRREDKVNTLEGPAWDFWVDVNYQVAHEPSILGGVEHLLAVCRKPKWRPVLRGLAQKLNEEGFVYRVVGGAALALRRLPVPVADLDLEMEIHDAYRFQETFADRAVQPVAWREGAQIRSHFGRFIFDDVRVEVMAGLERRVEGERWAPSLASTRATVELEGVGIPVLTLEEETLAYLRRGKLERAALALPLCDPDALQSLLRDAQNRRLF